MPTTAIIFGRLLIILGIIGYGYGYMNGNASITALIPSFFGIALMSLGHFSKLREDLRKHLMHFAAMIGLIGFILPLWRLISSSFKTITVGDTTAGASTFSFGFTSVMLILMSILCLVFLILCVKSFVDARRSGAI